VKVLLASWLPIVQETRKIAENCWPSCGKKAGKVRDLDVQLGLLRNLKSPQAAGHKAQLQRFLSAERAKQEKKLHKALIRRL